MQQSPRFGRRVLLRSAGTVALGGLLAGCSTTQGGGGGSEGGETTDAVAKYLDRTSNFDGVVDARGESPTVAVGVQANGGAFGFGPPAIRIEPETTVTWEWTGEGSFHDVVHEDGAFESEQRKQAGVTFEYAFEESDTYLYYCVPHESLGMKGAIIVG